MQNLFAHLLINEKFFIKYNVFLLKNIKLWLFKKFTYWPRMWK